MSKAKTFLTSVRFIRAVSIAAVVLWMGVIFIMSAENGSESTETSDSVVYFIASLTVDGFDDLSDKEKAEIIDGMSGFVRTAGHFCEFAVLGALSLNASRTFEIKKRFRALFAFLFSVLYAVSDEIHQYFVPDRACDIKDVAVDSLGALTGIAIMCLLAGLAVKIKSRKSKNDTENNQNG